MGPSIDLVHRTGSLINRSQTGRGHFLQICTDGPCQVSCLWMWLWTTQSTRLR